MLVDLMRKKQIREQYTFFTVQITNTFEQKDLMEQEHFFSAYANIKINISL